MSLIAPASAWAQKADGLGAERALGAVSYFAAWLIGTIALLAIAALAVWLVPEEHAQRIAESAKRQPRRWVGLSLLFGVGVPLTIFVLAATILALPLAIASAILAVPLATIGYVTSGWLIGRALSDWRMRPAIELRDRLMWTLIGVGILRVVSLVPVLDFFVLVAACSLGAGAILTAYDRSRGTRATPRRRRRAEEDDVLRSPIVHVPSGAAG
ncbi:MAG: hypothetical protein M3Y87_11030 [Myxococcota bacterium]|nr:hypothetical protein [Myxococcota bacterium]